MEQHYENLGQIIDEIENISFALSLPLPAEMHVASMRSLLPEKIEKLKEAFIAITGENPWE